MKKNSILISGCSFSDYCGWGQVGDHSNSKCWYNIFSAQFDVEITNISYGGRSNREIIHLAGEHLLLNPKKYGQVIIQLSGTNRQWFFRDTDPTEFCIINGANISNSRTPQEYQALKTIQLDFSPTQKEIEKDLVSLLMLQFYLQQNSIDLILINAMDAGYHMGQNTLCELLDLAYSIGFDTPLINQQVDYADDNLHPGEKTNKIYANLVANVYSQLSDSSSSKSV